MFFFHKIMTDSLGELIFVSLARRGEWAVILKLYTAFTESIPNLLHTNGYFYRCRTTIVRVVFKRTFI